MDFCPKCGSIMVPTKRERKLVLLCSSCQETLDMQEDGKIKEVVDKKEKEIELIDSSKEDDTLPLTDAECPKCKNEKAHYWTVQTRAGDEPETKFLKCSDCKHVWRDYS